MILYIIFFSFNLNKGSPEGDGNDFSCPILTAMHHLNKGSPEGDGNRGTCQLVNQFLVNLNKGSPEGDGSILCGVALFS